jgi:hypothetical protein
VLPVSPSANMLSSSGFPLCGCTGWERRAGVQAVSPLWVRSAEPRGGSRMSDGRNAIAARFSVYGLRGTHTRSAEPVAAEPSVWRSGRARAARAACCPRCPYCLRCPLPAACCVQKLSTRAGGGVEPRAALVTCGENRSRLQAPPARARLLPAAPSACTCEPTPAHRCESRAAGGGPPAQFCR